MKTLKITLLLLCYSVTSQAQYTNCYYFLVNEASFLLHEKKYNESVKLYEKAFALNPDTFGPDFFVAARAYDNLGNNKQVWLMLQKAVRKGYTWAQIEKIEWVNFKKSKYWDKLKAEYPKQYWQFLENRDDELRDQIIRFDHADQFPRVYLYDNSPFSHQLLKKIDSLNMALFKKLIAEKGFPDLQNIGYRENYYNAVPLLLHFCKYSHESYLYFDPIMRQAVKDGKLRPEHYAFIVDMYTSQFDRETLFLEGLKSYKQAKNVPNIAEIDLRRFNLGLIPLYQSAQQFNKELPEGYQRPTQETLNNWCNCDKQK